MRSTARWTSTRGVLADLLASCSATRVQSVARAAHGLNEFTVSHFDAYLGHEHRPDTLRFDVSPSVRAATGLPA